MSRQVIDPKGKMEIDVECFEQKEKRLQKRCESVSKKFPSIRIQPPQSPLTKKTRLCTNTRQKERRNTRSRREKREEPNNLGS
jgi:hypothetical protein